MITHVVQWKVKDEAGGLDKAAILEKLQSDLEGLVGQIEEILSLTVGVNQTSSDAASDIVLLSSFADWECMRRYQEHPAHLRVVDFVKQVAIERRVVDFEA